MTTLVGEAVWYSVPGLTRGGTCFFLLFLGSFNTRDGDEGKDDKEDEKKEKNWEPGKQGIAVTISTQEDVS